MPLEAQLSCWALPLPSTAVALSHQRRSCLPFKAFENIYLNKMIVSISNYNNKIKITFEININYNYLTGKFSLKIKHNVVLMSIKVQ